MTVGDNMASEAATTGMAAGASALDSESQKQRGDRVEDLWRRLDPQGDKELDLKGLKKGLRRIDHPMKNADDMLRDIIRRVDANGDGKIQFEGEDANGGGYAVYGQPEFRVFVEAAERQLLLLFRSIDRDHDGRLNRNELRAAFQKSGLAVPARRLNGFFDEIDSNRDGYITFDEWRDFLLFIPVKDSYSTLEAAFSYYASIVVLNAEGDSMVSDETLEGLGTTGFLFQTLFGSILKLAKPDSTATPGTAAAEQPHHHHRARIRRPSPDSTSERIPSTSVADSQPAPSPLPPPPLPPDAAQGGEVLSGAPGAPAAVASSVLSGGGRGGGGHGAGAPRDAARSVFKADAGAETVDGLGYRDVDEDEDYENLDTDVLPDSTSATRTPSGAKLQKSQKAAARAQALKESKFQLTQYVPHPGYFLAGALAGGISRTATAPFDRLKVYLLVNTRSVAGSSGAATGPAAAAKPAVSSTSTTATPSTKATTAAKPGRPTAALRTGGGTIPEAMASLYKAGGLRTFFAGNGLNVVKIMPETAIKFGSYEAAKRGCAAVEGHYDATRIKPSSKFIAGGVAGMVAQFFVYPLDTLKFRLQCETVQGGATGNALLVQTAKRMWASGGVRAAYRGVTMGLIGMFPYSAIDMGTFELLKSTFTRYKAQYYGLHEEDAGPGNVVTGIIGATSGAFGASVVYPLNVLRTRLQTQGTAMHPPTYTGIWDVAQRTLANEGARGLYKGLTPNLLKVAPALSITWVVYERSKKLMGLP